MCVERERKKKVKKIGGGKIAHKTPVETAEGRRSLLQNVDRAYARKEDVDIPRRIRLNESDFGATLERCHANENTLTHTHDFIQTQCKTHFNRVSEGVMENWR